MSIGYPLIKVFKSIDKCYGLVVISSGNHDCMFLKVMDVTNLRIPCKMCIT